MAFAIEGISFPAIRYYHYDSETLLDRIDHIKSMNAEWITLSPHFYTTDKYSHDFHNHTLVSISDADLQSAIEASHAAGLKVFVKPMLRMDHWEFPNEPTNVEAWFAGYEDWIVRYASIAQKAGAEMFSIGNELAALSPRHPAEWAHLVAGVNAVYDGLVTYSAQWATVGRADPIWKLDGVDIIGVNAYVPLTTEGNLDVTLAEIKDGWHSNDHYNAHTKAAYNNMAPLDFFGALAVKYNKPLMHTEMGYVSKDGTAAVSWSTTKPPLVPDWQEQADAFEAYFSEWAKVALPTDKMGQTITADRFFLGTQLWWTKANGEVTPLGAEYETKPAESIIRGHFASGAGQGSDGGGTNSSGGGNTVSIDAKGTQASGQYAEMQLLVDGVLEGSRTVTATTKTYQFIVDDLKNASTLEVRFSNDGTDASGNDRNLIVTKVVAGGQLLLIPDATYERDGKSDLPGQSGLWWAGELNFDLGGGSDVVTIDARGTQASGEYAKMQLLVDGVSKGIQTVTAATKSYQFNVDGLKAASSLEVRFTNDGQDASGNDRNLIVTKVVAAGQQLEIGDAVYERDGKPTLPGQQGLWWTGELNFDLDTLLS